MLELLENAKAQSWACAGVHLFNAQMGVEGSSRLVSVTCWQRPPLLSTGSLSPNISGHPNSKLGDCLAGDALINLRKEREREVGANALHGRPYVIRDIKKKKRYTKAFFFLQEMDEHIIIMVFAPLNAQEDLCKSPICLTTQLTALNNVTQLFPFFFFFQEKKSC